MTKPCSKCKESKNLGEFGRQTRSKDGLSAWCKNCKKLNMRDWTLRNKESELERQREWYGFNREKKNERNKDWQKNNKAKVNAITAKRRATKLAASPAWLSAENNEEIKGFYSKARELTESTGIRHEVDHIVPLQGKGVIGLHVPWNLQILTKYENLSKGNSHGSNLKT